MAYRTVQLHCEKSHLTQIKEIMGDPVIIDKWLLFEDEGRVFYEFLLREDDTQKLMDKIQTFLKQEVPDDAIGLEKVSNVRVIVSTVQAVWPRDEKKEEKNTSKFSGLSREELFENLAKGAKLNSTFFMLVVLSTVVAAIGMIADDTAVVVGAMVIAPLLAPNLALALSTALGDMRLMMQSIGSNVIGLLTVIALGAIVGYIMPIDFDSDALMARTSVSYEGIILAIAAGAAGVLSLTTGVSSVLVGVMVAVALLPPATAVGIMLGSGEMQLAAGAALLLAVNVVCINLAAKVVFLLKGVRPLTGLELKRAHRAMFWYLFVWTASLTALAYMIYISKEFL